MALGTNLSASPLQFRPQTENDIGRLTVAAEQRLWIAV